MNLALTLILLFLCTGIYAQEENCPLTGLPDINEAIKAVEERLNVHKEINADFCQFQKACDEGLNYQFSKTLKPQDCKYNASSILQTKSCRALSDYEYLSLKDYTGKIYMCMNKYLRQKEYKSPVIDNYISYATAGMSKLPSYEGFVVRGAMLDENLRAAHQEGNVMVYDSFTSASTAGGFAHVTSDKFIIYSKKAKLIMSISQFEGESEALFMPGTKFEIIERREINHQHYYIMGELSDNKKLTSKQKEEILKQAKQLRVGTPEYRAPVNDNHADSWVCSDEKVPKKIKQVNLPSLRIPQPTE